MKKLLLTCTALLAIGCARTRPIPRPPLPAVVAPVDADALYAAQRLVCDGGSCERDGVEYSISQLGPTAYFPAASMIRTNRKARGAVILSTAGLSATAAVCGLYGLAYAQPGREKEIVRNFGAAAAGSLILSLAALVFWPDPGESFAEEYNRSLRRDIESRVPASVVVAE